MVTIKDMMLPQGTQGLGGALQAASPLLMAMSQGLLSGRGAGANMNQGLAGMMALADKKKADARAEQDQAWQQTQRGWAQQDRGFERERRGWMRQDRTRANEERQTEIDRRQQANEMLTSLPGLAEGIMETANAIGADPIDLATTISYETAGTFDPVKAGPTTQYGQHRGLIQFGEPQAQQHGVDFSSPEAAMRSQLGAHGAIASYFQRSGFRPGMSGMDLYSTVNAGAPGRYGASDANNGGAPGDVRDKWNNQMAGHRAKAEQLMAGLSMGTPVGAPQQPAQPMPQEQSPQVDPARLLQILNSPYVSDEAKEYVMQQYGPQEQPDQTTAQQNYQFMLQQGIPPEMAMERAFGGGGTNVTVNNGGEPRGKPLGTSGDILVEDPNAAGGYRVVQAEGSEAAREREVAESKRGMAAEQSERAGNIVIEDIARVRDMLTGGRNQPVTGFAGALAARAPGTEATDARALVETIKANVGFDRLQQMKEASPTGGALGSVTERELSVLQSVLGNLEFSQSREQLLENLDRLEEVYNGIVEKAARTGDGTFVPRVEEQQAPMPQTQSAAPQVQPQQQQAPQALRPEEIKSMTMDQLIGADMSNAPIEAIHAWNKRYEEINR